MAAMFKKEKDLIERSRALLKNKETKKLKAEVSNVANQQQSINQCCNQSSSNSTSSIRMAYQHVVEEGDNLRVNFMESAQCPQINEVRSHERAQSCISYTYYKSFLDTAIQDTNLHYTKLESTASLYASDIFYIICCLTLTDQCFCSFYLPCTSN